MNGNFLRRPIATLAIGTIGRQWSIIVAIGVPIDLVQALYVLRGELAVFLLVVPNPHPKHGRILGRCHCATLSEA